MRKVLAKSIIDYIRLFLLIIVRLTIIVIHLLHTNFPLNSFLHFYIHFRISLQVYYRNRDSGVSRGNVSRDDRLIAITSRNRYGVIFIKIFCAECSNIFVSQRISANGQCPKNTKLAWRSMDESKRLERVMVDLDGVSWHLSLRRVSFQGKIRCSHASRSFFPPIVRPRVHFLSLQIRFAPRPRWSMNNVVY